MIGRGVIEAGVLSSLLGFWLAFLCIPQGIQIYWDMPLLNEKSYYVLISAMASIVSAIYLSAKRIESDVVEVFGRYGLIIFGGLATFFFYIFPFVLYGGGMPRGDGVTLRLISAGVGSNFFLSVIVALPFSLGAFSLYIFLQGFKGYGSK